MRRFFCDCCGKDITVKANRYNVSLFNRTTKTSETKLHLCADDIKKVRNMKLVPMSNVRIRRIPEFYNVVVSHLNKSESVYILPEWNVTQLESLNRKDPTKLRTADGNIYYTKEYILSRVDGSVKPEQAKHRLIEWTQLLFKHQTEDEKKNYETKYHNNRGFNKPDAKFMSAMARVAFDRGEDALSDKQIAQMYKMFTKYAEQVADILNEESEA